LHYSRVRGDRPPSRLSRWRQLTSCRCPPRHTGFERLEIKTLEFVARADEKVESLAMCGSGAVSCAPECRFLRGLIAFMGDRQLRAVRVPCRPLAQPSQKLSRAQPQFAARGYLDGCAQIITALHGWRGGVLADHECPSKPAGTTKT